MSDQSSIKAKANKVVSPLLPTPASTSEFSQIYFPR